MSPTRASRRGGAVLLAVLIVIVVLALAAYRYSDLMVAEARASDSAVRAAQAKALAVSGVHYAAAALADANTVNSWNGNVFDNAAAFRNIAVNADDRPRFAGRFSLPAPPPVDEALNGSTQTRFGVVDESGKLNVNAWLQADPSGDALKTALMKLPNMTDEIADAIIDWIDEDSETRANGAENEFYGGMTNGYRCKNGPLDTLEELLLVRGVTPELLFGTDRNRNGRADPGEGDDTGFDPGWSAYLTVASQKIAKSSDGEDLINLDDSDLSALYEKLNTALGEEAAAFVVAYRQYGPGTNAGRDVISKSKIPSLSNSTSNRLPYLSQLLTANSVTIRPANPQGGNGPSYRNPFKDASLQRDLLQKLYDKCTSNFQSQVQARVNINSAPRAVLIALPNLTDAEVDAIIAARKPPGSAEASEDVYTTIAWLVTELKWDASRLNPLESYANGRTQTYRVQSLGYFDQGGPVARVEAVIDTNGGQPRIVYFRDLTELGRGFEVPR
jgi:type II secretory pathway component PulK